MTDSRHLRHRRAFGHRARHPQSGFSPTAIFDIPFPTLIPSGLVPLGLVSGVTQIIPSAVPSILGLSTSSTKVSTSTTSLDTSTSSTTSTTSSTTSSTTPTTKSTTTTSASTSHTVTPLAALTSTHLVLHTISTTASTRPSTTGTITTLASSGLSTGTVVGGIGAAIIGTIILTIIIAFFLRRSRSRNDDLTDFDPKAFRRSAAVLSDTPTHEDTIARGFNPRPPTMIEKRLASSPTPTFGTQCGAPPTYNEHFGGYPEKHAGFASHFPSHSPGQVINVHPTFAPSIHHQSPFSSLQMPISPYKEQHSDQQHLAGQPPMGANSNGPVLTRQLSAQSSSDGPRSFPLPKETAPANDYVDISRSSVSPFQAAQYIEISRRLNTEVPKGLQSSDADRDLPPLPPGSEDIPPFADPESAPSSPEAEFAIDHRNLNPSPRPKSGESISSAVLNTLDFPVPPLPAYTVSSRYRVDSFPPTLPEINIGSMTRYSALKNTATVAAGHGFSGVNQKFPASLSPLALSFEIPPITNVERTSFSAAQPASTAAPAIPIEKKRATTFSMYDPEDAYGGI